MSRFIMARVNTDAEPRRGKRTTLVHGPQVRGHFRFVDEDIDASGRSSKLAVG